MQVQVTPPLLLSSFLRLDTKDNAMKFETQTKTRLLVPRLYQLLILFSLEGNLLSSDVEDGGQEVG